VFVFSGGAQDSLDSIDQAPVVQLDETRAGALMFRDESADAPYNLWAHVDQMFKAEKDAKPVPPPPVRSRTEAGEDAPVTRHAVKSVRIGFRPAST
jgi:hypothetical protein